MRSFECLKCYGPYLELDSGPASKPPRERRPETRGALSFAPCLRGLAVCSDMYVGGVFLIYLQNHGSLVSPSYGRTCVYEQIVPSECYACPSSASHALRGVSIPFQRFTRGTERMGPAVPNVGASTSTSGSRYPFPRSREPRSVDRDASNHPGRSTGKSISTVLSSEGVLKSRTT